MSDYGIEDSESEEPDEVVEGDTDPDEESTPIVSYDVSSFGSDPEVEGIVSRLRRGSIKIPEFQRDYVWRLPEASRFIESLLLGLPVPGIFLAVEPNTGKQLVIDGQQRLKTLLFFYDGYFDPKPNEQRRRVFSLSKVQPAYEGKTYKTLDEESRNKLDTAIIHATTVKQSSPPEDDTSLYHIFERLNCGGRKLYDQEMRIAVYHGSLIDELKNINTYINWRNIFGKPSKRLKDQELILRFFALFENRASYSRPMSEFLNKYALKNQNAPQNKLEYLANIFSDCLDVLATIYLTNHRLATI
ncbi:DUF262 domain-containing protein [Nisaea sp.]|uniref:DUF262 domain-containing protein n=1 Tax=Nisaea sp. TaxID=2024842 RepID=UPI003B517671